MTNEEAKDLYYQATQCLNGGDYANALALFDQIEAERPNSKHVMYSRALCLIPLGRISEAEDLCGKLEGKLEPEKLGALRAKIGASAPASIAPASTAEGNVIVVESAYPVSTTETTITGRVEAGVFHVGDSLTILSEGGMPMLAPIVRIGTADTPLNLVRAGQKAVMLLQIEPSHVAPGMRITAQSQQEAYAATVVYSAEPDADAPVENQRGIGRGRTRFQTRRVRFGPVHARYLPAARPEQHCRASLDGPCLSRVTQPQRPEKGRTGRAQSL